MSVARLVVVEQVSWQQADDDGVPCSNGFASTLRSDARPYLRRLTATEDWSAIDAGWVGDAADTIWICNVEGKRLAANPTPEQAAEIASRVIQIGRPAIGVSGVMEICYVPPGEHVRLRLSFEAKDLRVRCVKGVARYDLAVYPG